MTNQEKTQGNLPTSQNKPTSKPLTNKDKLFLTNLKECNYNQTKAYERTYPKANYNVARKNGCLKTKKVTQGNNNVLNEIDEQWIVGKLKEFVISSKKASDKIRATELLGKWKALFTDKSETTNKNPDKLVIMYNKEPQTQHSRIDTTKEEV